MCTPHKLFPVRVFISLAVLGMAPALTLAQSPLMVGLNPTLQGRRALALQQAAFNSALLGQALPGVSPLALGFNSAIAPALAYAGLASLYGNPYTASSANLYGASPYFSAGYGLNPYTGNNSAYGSGNNSAYGSGYEDPFGAYLRGTAAVINSEGQALVNIQQAGLMSEKVRRERLENRRRAFDQNLYERDHAPTPEDDRQKAQHEQLQRSQNDPPLGEITSAVALNTLLADVQRKADQTQGPDVSLEPDVLRHLNVKSPSGRGNPGLLKNEGRFNWPVVFHGPQYQEERTVLTDLTLRAYEQMSNGRVGTGTLASLTGATRRLQDKWRDHIKDLTPKEYSEGRRFLSAIEDAVTWLRQPDAGDYFVHKAPRGKTIADLVRHMTKQGLVFAPAIPGDEAAYLAVHRALVVYDSTDSGKRLAAGR